MHIGRRELLSGDTLDFLKAKGIWDTVSYKLTPEGVIESLDCCGIDHGVIFPLTFMPPDGKWEKLNEMTASYVQQYPDRLVGLAIINPKDIDGSIKELDRSFNNFGLSGVKFHPTMQMTYINDINLDPIYRFCQDSNKPMIIHTGASLPSYSDKYSMPLLIDDVAAKFPNLEIIMAHGGRPLYQDAAMILRKHKNVYFDICANIGRKGANALLELALFFMKIYADGLKKGLFGSDFPIYSPEDTLNHLRPIQENPNFMVGELFEITNQEMELILGLNAISLFKI
jgi:predicted TIM-barrel fold metal-dependent hydrolase